MASPFEAIATARATLARCGLSAAEAAFDAEVLARHVLGWDRAQLLANGRGASPPHFDQAFAALIVRRAAREPVAQILGHREFWGLEFEVTADVLVPRPETEILVEESIAFLRGRASASVIDVGTGSGCIAVSLAHSLPSIRVLALDLSDPALAVARRNAVTLGVAERIVFRQGNVLDGVDVIADLIVSNPPYVADADAARLQPEVVEFEPHLALFGGEDGLQVMRRLMAQSARRLAPDGRLIVEFGFDQERVIRALAAAYGWDVRHIRADLQGIPRTAVLVAADGPRQVS
jgi:release factor glutamine methyltransferase